MGDRDMPCREAAELLDDYLEGRLAANERALLERHLEECPGCRTLLEQVRTTVRALGALGGEALDPAVREGLLRAFGEWAGGRGASLDTSAPGIHSGPVGQARRQFAMGRQSDARERLVASAAELWHARSYADVGVSEICDHAGVQKGSFYHFFASKRDLALAVIDDNWERNGVGMMAPILTGPLPPLQRFVQLFERGMEEQLMLKEATGATVGCSFGNLAVELSTVDEVLRERLSRLFDDWAMLFKHALDDAVAAGELPEMDTWQAARALLAFIEGLGVLIKAKDDPHSVEDIVPLAFRVIGADPAAVAAAAAT